MRYRKPRVPWEGHRRAAHRQPGIWVSGRILDLADPVKLPALDRVQPGKVDRGRSEDRTAGVRQPWGGTIVDDYLDGRRVYPEPPHLSRRVDRLGRLLRRASAPIWIFVLLACAQTFAAVGDLASATRSAAVVPSSVPYAVYACALALLPAGVLIWRSDAWRSARLVMAGAVIWTTVPLSVSLSWRLADAIGLEGRAAIGLGLALGLAAILAGLGPFLIAFGLNRVRRSGDPWLWPVTWRAGGVMALPALYIAGPWLQLATDQWNGPPTGEAGARLTVSLAAAAAPLELFGLGVLAGLCLSSLLAVEPQNRLWQCAAAGAAALLGAGVYALNEGAPLGILASADSGVWGWRGVAMAMQAAGGGLLLLAFTSTVWSAAGDADGQGHGAPSEVFSWGLQGWATLEPLAMDDIVSVAAGADHALAVDGHGRIGAWGDNSLGQIDVPDGLGDVIAVAAGNGFSLALRATGTVVAWGANDRGQTDVPGSLTGVTAIAAGHGFALALRSDGTVVAWGDAADGATSVPSDLAGVAAISAGARHALALRPNGSVVGWGDNSCSQSKVPLRLNRAKAISAGGDFSLALLADGTVVAWGDNSYGQLDVPERLSNVAAISAGAFHAVALLANGDVIGWGGGRMAGDADRPWRLVDFRAVAAGDGFSLAIRVA